MYKQIQGYDVTATQQPFKYYVSFILLQIKLFYVFFCTWENYKTVYVNYNNMHVVFESTNCGISQKDNLLCWYSKG